MPEAVVIDNEKSLNSVSRVSMMEDGFKIKNFKTPPYKSEVNGQIERFHSTLSEIKRCLKSDGIERTFEELLERGVLGTVFSEVQILDYTNSQIVSASLGKAKISDGNFKLIHVIELENYQNFINQMQKTLGDHVKKEHPVFPYLNHELEQIQTLLNGLKFHKPRMRAISLDFIGSAWKWIAGSSDHDDFEIISNKINKN